MLDTGRTRRGRKRERRVCKAMVEEASTEAEGGRRAERGGGRGGEGRRRARGMLRAGRRRGRGTVGILWGGRRLGRRGKK